ncbi:MAG: chromosome segregation protein SMC [Rhodospirillales bacterium]|nr:chromosome segregation protein SMC [Rhodospirillales bacterium]
MRFKKLRLSGFKSFVDGSDLQIELGLTGVVGPNGCGKSNLVEALRWVMGETSAKQMRGGEMNDVIFGGTRNRPARNIAEVILSLDNTARVAPAQFNDVDELEVSRRIERDKGSTYRINGHEVRARDVQLLFADSATGARSTALVSQGKISSIIAAKPTERRLLLEEAAGITGLHSRRHEAELRLRGAESNMERLDDVLITLEAQLAHLKKQVRQATRYRNLSDLIRKAEATLFFLRWTADEATLEAATKEFAEIEAVVNEQTSTAARAAVLQAEHATNLPQQRQAEAEAAAELQRLTLARDSLETEEQRVAEQANNCRNRIGEIAADKIREETLVSDAASALTRLEDERDRIQVPADGEENALTEAAENLATAIAQVDTMDARLTVLTEQVANDEARRSALEHKVTDLKHRKERLNARRLTVTNQSNQLQSDSPESSDLTEAEKTLADALLRREATRDAAGIAETQRAEAISQFNTATNEYHSTNAAASRLKAEVEALSEILDSEDSDQWPPVIDALGVETGYEAALAVALGEDLSASDNEAAPSHWRALAPLANAPALPSGARPLSDFVRAPASLDRRLSQVGVVEDDTEARRLAADLVQGQRIVSRSGALWRWDGFTISATATTPAQARLEQRKRLKSGQQKLAQANSETKTAEDRHSKAKAADVEAREAEKTAREAANAADAAYGRARDRVAEIKERSAGRISLLESLRDQIIDIATDIEHLEAEEKEAAETLSAIPDAEGPRAEIIALREDLAERRSNQVECQSHHDTLERAAEERIQRLGTITSEIESWVARRQIAQTQLQQLEERREHLEQDLERLAARPAEIQEQRQSLLGSLERAEENRKTLADTLAQSEHALAEADRNLRSAEAQLAAARENMVRLQGLTEQAKQSCLALAERINDRLECRPDQLFEISELKPDVDIPDLDTIERKVERLNRERETMGPVNLRAESEAEEMTQQIDTLSSEREDLLKAIDKLRRGISELNREGRQRLLASFEEVNKYFQEFFLQLFGGGRAHLELTESDDPLDAGLEIMASPPGKRLQVLSLLSGGEQALTALALLFAVFQTNPAPICVLDEVDAPLDDANVDRFCSMVEKMASTDSTRFLIITHHRMTMARMDRLFGVTMTERGISQLVSVDLHRADELRATA